MLSDYFQSPINTSETHKMAELISLLKDVKSQNIGIMKSLSEIKELLLIECPSTPAATITTTERCNTSLQIAPQQTERQLPLTVRRPLFEVNQGQELPWEKLMEIKQKSSSVQNFAVNCMLLLFRSEELEGRNIAGRRNKMAVDPVRVQEI